MFVCSLSYPACKALSPVIQVLSPVACTAISYFSPKRHHFRKNVIEHKMRVLICFTTFTWNVSHSKNNSARYYLNVHWSSREVPRYSLHTLTKLEAARHIFEKYSNIKFHETPSSGSRIVSCGQRDRQTNRHDELYYTWIANLMHWLLFIHKILISSTCFEHQVLIFRRT